MSSINFSVVLCDLAPGQGGNACIEDFTVDSGGLEAEAETPRIDEHTVEASPTDNFSVQISDEVP